jgi:hypothetical protein
LRLSCLGPVVDSHKRRICGPAAGPPFGDIMSQATLSQADVAYLNELAADIAAHGGLGAQTIAEAMAQAHKRRQAFIREMLDQSSQRSRDVAKVLCTKVYSDLASKALMERTMRSIEGERRDSVVAELRREAGGF